MLKCDFLETCVFRWLSLLKSIQQLVRWPEPVNKLRRQYYVLLASLAPVSEEYSH